MARKKTKLLDSTGKLLNPEPPAGLYAAANCPVCGSPIFYHGGGEHIEYSPTGPAKVYPIKEAVLTVCDCPKGEVALNVPDEYTLLAERQAIIFLFSAIHKYQEVNADLVEQLQEAIKELQQRVGDVEQGGTGLHQGNGRDEGDGKEVEQASIDA